MSRDLPRGIPSDERLELGDRPLALGGVLDDAVFRKSLPSDLELRLHEGDDLGPRCDDLDERRNHVLERDERDVDGNDVDRIGDVLRLEVSGVDPFANDDTRVVTQAGVHLIVSDVERVDFGCPVLKQAVGEPAGRGADVETDPALDFDAELDQRPPPASRRRD